MKTLRLPISLLIIGLLAFCVVRLAYTQVSYFPTISDFGSASFLKVPTSAGAAPTASGRIAYDSTANTFVGGVNDATKTFATADSVTQQGAYNNSGANPEIVAGANGLIISSLSSTTRSLQLLNAAKTDGLLLYHDATLGAQIATKLPSNTTIRCDTNQNCVFRDVENSCDILTIDPDAASPNAAWTYTCAGTKPLKSVYFDAAALSTDGTNCVAPVEATLNAGPKTWTFTCADNAASIFYGKVTMPDSWDAGTLTYELNVWHGTTETITFAGDFDCQCRGDGEVPSSTWGTVQAADVSITTANQVEHQTTAATTCTGTCAAGDQLFWRYVVDAATFSANAANTKVLGVKMEYSISSVSD